MVSHELFKNPFNLPLLMLHFFRSRTVVLVSGIDQYAFNELYFDATHASNLMKVLLGVKARPLWCSTSQLQALATGVLFSSYHTKNKEWPCHLELLWKASMIWVSPTAKSLFRRLHSWRNAQSQAANYAAWISSGLPFDSKTAMVQTFRRTVHRQCFTTPHRTWVTPILFG
jgi:hypothetical protein